MTATQAPPVDFDGLIRDHAGLISRIARSFEANEQDREDLKQDILLAIWRALPLFRGDSSLKTFVAQIAQKRAVSHVRQHARRGRSAPLDDQMARIGPVQEEQAIQNDLQRKLARLLAGLPLAQRETALLVLEGFSYSEIASILGISVNAATLRCTRARAYLTDALRDG
ncbi:hypothetical protein ASE86_04155 [Sphingomonas sp. Leaf33]|uniref:RNA polymerase sigma factor n=1 Tax=Sphingomonas sp. Leaf33 TaxID=1736215 RepID=UPI0006FA38F1|nr:RNA polymerase sigma factor [Sphingomonas sp. Leaf33]KQN25440.1 hypothetical protein ASE86_04155 [Sphingomonas sp. Leaf33]